MRKKRYLQPSTEVLICELPVLLSGSLVNEGETETFPVIIDDPIPVPAPSPEILLDPL